MDSEEKTIQFSIFIEFINLYSKFNILPNRAGVELNKKIFLQTGYIGS